MKKILLFVSSTLSLYGFSESYGSDGGYESGGKAPIGQIVDAGLFDPWANDPRYPGNKPQQKRPPVQNQAEQNPKNQEQPPQEGRLKTPPPRLKQDSIENKTDYEYVQKQDSRFPETIAPNTGYSITTVGEREAPDVHNNRNRQNRQDLDKFMETHPDKAYLHPDKLKVSDLKPYSEWPNKPAMRHNESNLIDWEMGSLKMKDGYLYDNWGNKVGKHMFDNNYAKQNGHTSSGNNFIYFEDDYKINGKTIVKGGSYKILGTSGVIYDSDGNPYGKMVSHGNLKKSSYDVLTQDSYKPSKSSHGDPHQSRGGNIHIKGDNDLH
jgi:hypothetical protein